MCGRYVQASSSARLAAAFAAANATGGTELVSFNRAPTQPTPAVLPDGAGGIRLVMLRWGLVPSWSAGIAPLHHRMPVLVGKDGWPAWLTAPDGDVPALLCPNG